MSSDNNQGPDHDSDPIRNVTRSDIESRVGLKNKRVDTRTSGRHHPKSNNLAQTATGNSRKTRLLGGQLGSITRKRKMVQSSKLGWWILGTFIVLIAIALIIPEPGRNNNLVTSREGALLSTPELDAIYRDAQIDEANGTLQQTENSFVRQDDLGRAQAYAEEERITTAVQDFLEIARQLENTGQFSDPREDNAADMYQKVLELEPSNSEATQGIGRIITGMSQNGSAALSANNLPEAQNLLLRMQEIDPENRRTLSFEDAIRQYQVKQDERASNIDELLSAAESSLSDGAELSPPRANAVFYYQQVLSFEPDNVIALGGIDRIITQQLELANEAILSNNFDAATSRLNAVSTLAPDNPSLALLRNQVDALSIASTATPTTTPTQMESGWLISQNENHINDSMEPAQNPKPLLTVPSSGVDASTGQTEQRTNVAIIETQITAEQPTTVLSLSEFDMAAGLQHYYHGRYDEAYSALKPLADRGVARAQFRVAVMWQLGRGVAENTSFAEDLFRRSLPAVRASAEAGEDWAQADLGSLYEDGMVVAQDMEKAY
ncbi:MAG: hypothetical protein HOM55_03690, partial [Proteobacteria bacterium]|nr:hypothetical protein [Pseudomonadota bacterium]